MDIDIDIGRFEITEVDYRSIFCKSSNKKISHLVFKFFDIENNLDMDKVPQKHN